MCAGPGVDARSLALEYDKLKFRPFDLDKASVCDTAWQGRQSNVFLQLPTNLGSPVDSYMEPNRPMTPLEISCNVRSIIIERDGFKRCAWARMLMYRMIVPAYPPIDTFTAL